MEWSKTFNHRATNSVAQSDGITTITILVQVNFIDVCVSCSFSNGEHYSTDSKSAQTYFRSGVYPSAPPVVLGNEPAGKIAKLGPGVNPATYGFDVGTDVAVRQPR